MLDTNKRDRSRDSVRGGNAVILPYVETEDGWTITDRGLIDFWNLLAVDGITKTAFWGEINSWQELKENLRSSQTLSVFAFYPMNGKLRVAALCYINDIRRNNALAHHCFLKWTWGKHTQEIGRAILDHWFSMTKEDGSPVFEVLLGTTPIENRRAVAFAKRLGFTVAGEIPKIGGGKDVVISHLTRERFYGRQK